MTILPRDDQATVQVFDVELETMMDAQLTCHLEDDCHKPVTHIGVMLPCGCLGQPGCLSHIETGIRDGHRELFEHGRRFTCTVHKTLVTSLTSRPI